MPLEELIEIKVREIRSAAEDDFFALFIQHPDDVAHMGFHYVVMRALTGRQLAVQERDRFNDALALINRMRALCADARAATTEAELAAINW